MFRRSLAAGLACALTCFALAMTPLQATAADIKLLGGTSMRVLFSELLPQFERSSGHKVALEYGTLGANRDRVMKGEAIDVVIVTPAQNDELQKQSKLLAASRAELARVGYGVFVKTGATKPDLGTVDEFKRTMLTAKSIALGNPAGGGPLSNLTRSQTSPSGQRLRTTITLCSGLRPALGFQGANCHHTEELKI